jgi:hypothetical protein
VGAINTARVFRFLPKPLSVVQLFEAVEAAVTQHDVAIAEQQLLDSTLRSTINILVEIISTIDPRSFEISQRLRRTVRTFATELNLPHVWELELAAVLARIGTATLPTTVLFKLGAGAPLNIEEKTLLAGVPEIGWRLLKTIPRLEGVAEAVRFQAKHFDGHGVPRNIAISGEAIPLGGRILKIFTDRALFEMDGIAKSQARRQMEERLGEYDPHLLEESFRSFPDYILQGVSAALEVQTVYAQDLRPEQTVVTDIKTSDGMVIVAAGSRLTTMLIQRICNHLELGLLAEPFCVQDVVVEESATATELPFESPAPLFRVIEGGQAAN